jgi:hypothetical protein
MTQGFPVDSDDQQVYGDEPPGKTRSLETGRRRGGRIRRLWSTRDSHRRLGGKLTAYRGQLAVIDDVTGSERTTTLAPLLDATEAALADNDVDQAWACFHAALEVELLLDARAHEGNLHTWAELLAAEVQKVDSAWRYEAATALLAPDTRNPHTLYHARRLIDEHYDNMWRQLRTFRRYLAALASVSMLFVVGVVVVDALGGPLLPAVGTAHLVAVVLFGGLGATVSAALSAGRDSKRNPEQLVDTWVGLARVAVGMAAALALVTFLHSGFVSVGPPSPALALAVAFVAGFSDRLLVRTVGTVVEPRDGD